MASGNRYIGITSLKDITTTMLGLRNHFLLSMPQVEDDHFSNSVVQLCDVDSKGAMGIIVNRSLSMSLGDLLTQLDKEPCSKEVAERPVMLGGPLHTDRGFILHKADNKGWSSSLQVSDTLCLTSSMDILEAIAEGYGPDEYLVALGCAGWDIPQLADELKKNAWLTMESSEDVLFNTPIQERRVAAAAKLGIDFHLLGAVGNG